MIVLLCIQFIFPFKKHIYIYIYSSREFVGKNQLSFSRKKFDVSHMMLSIVLWIVYIRLNFQSCLNSTKETVLQIGVLCDQTTCSIWSNFPVIKKSHEFFFLKKKGYSHDNFN